MRFFLISSLYHRILVILIMIITSLVKFLYRQHTCSREKVYGIEKVRLIKTTQHHHVHQRVSRINALISLAHGRG